MRNNKAQRGASVDTTRNVADFHRLAQRHAASAADRVFAERVSLFEGASADPQSFWRGELCALPQPKDFGENAGSYTYFDHLVTEGSMQAVIGYINRQRVKERVAALIEMRATGDVEPFILLAYGLRAGIDRREAVALARLLLNAEIAALTNIDSQGLDVEQFQVPRLNDDWGLEQRSAGMVDMPAVDQPLSFDDLFQQWQRETKPSASTLSSWVGNAGHLKRFLGTKASDLATVTERDMVAWKNVLVQEGKAASTISRGHFGMARALFRFAVANKLLRVDPSAGIKVSGKAKAGTKRLPYDNSEVARLLLYAEVAKAPWCRWLPLLAAATGARIGELAQLHGSQIAERDGIAVIHIKPASDGGSIKNSGSERTVPLHDAVLNAGFLDFVRDRGAGPLFYNRTSGDPEKKHASKSVTNRLAAWVRRLGFRDPRKDPSHALRHWFKTECARLQIEDSVADAIQGHSDGSAAAAYRHISLEVMHATINRIGLLHNKTC